MGFFLFLGTRMLPCVSSAAATRTSDDHDTREGALGQTNHVGLLEHFTLRAQVPVPEHPRRRARTRATAGHEHVERRGEIIETEQSVKISRPVGEVFAFLTHVENWMRLQPTLRESKRETSRGPLKVGGTFWQTLDIPGQRVELLCRVIEIEKNERISLEYSWDQLSLDVGFVFESWAHWLGTVPSRWL